MTVRIVTDSASDLTHDEATALGVDVVPLSIRFGDDVFLDRVEIGIDEFYRRMTDSEDLQNGMRAWKASASTLWRQEPYGCDAGRRYGSGSGLNNGCCLWIRRRALYGGVGGGNGW